MPRAALFVLALAACSFDHGVAPDAGSGDPGDGRDAMRDGPPGTHRRMLDIDDARVSGGPHADFPLLVSLTAPWLRDTANGGDVARADGFDIYFTADLDSPAPLAHEVELYAPATGTLIAWVKLPSLTAATTLYLHYGDPARTTDPQNVPAVWSGGFEAVFHLEAIVDAAGKNPQLSSATSGTAVGVIDTAHSFDGADDRIDIGSATAVDDVFAGGGTAEAWFYAQTFGEGGYGRIFEKGHVSGWSIFVNNTERTSSVGFLHGTASAGWGWWNTGSGTITLDAWHHVAVTYNQDSAANEATLYLDGAVSPFVLLDTPTGSMVSDASQPLFAGNRPALDRTFAGLLDELRLSSVVRSAGWIATEVANQREPALFVTVGPEL